MPRYDPRTTQSTAQNTLASHGYAPRAGDGAMTKGSAVVRVLGDSDTYIKEVNGVLQGTYPIANDGGTAFGNAL